MSLSKTMKMYVLYDGRAKSGNTDRTANSLQELEKVSRNWNAYDDEGSKLSNGRIFKELGNDR